MGRFLLYGSCVIILIIGSWFYYQGDQIPENLMPLIVFLFATLFFGYSKKAQEDGDIGAASRRIYREKNPKIFQFALYLIYLITLLLVIWAGFLFNKSII